jgi:hypothetical protein
MLTSVRLENWRGHIDTTVPLSPFTVLVGANAVGKTAVLEGIDALGGILNETRVAPKRAAEQALRMGAEKAVIGATFSGIPKIEALKFELLHAAQISPTSSIVISPPIDGRNQLAFEDFAGRRTLLASARTATKSFLLEASPKRIVAPSKVSRLSPESDGFGTASALAAFKIDDDVRFDRIVERVRRIVPTVEALSLRPTPANEFVARQYREHGTFVEEYQTAEGYALWVKFIDGAILPAEAVSEGTLLAIATLTMIESSGASVLLIDDIDRALHMQAQSEFVRVLREIQKAQPTMQIIATTHSPLIVQHFDDDEVVVMARHPDARITAKKLSEHPDRKRYASLTAAELWVAEQEEWVLKS